MFRNYLTVALRILLRQKTYSGINILGLTAGVTAALLILLYIADEKSYDKFHPDADRIYRATFNAKIGDQDIHTTLTGLPLAEALQHEAAGIESVMRMDKWITCPVRYEDHAFTEMNFCLADSNFFSFFNFNLLAGNPDDVLRGPNKIVICETAARRYFDYKGRGDNSPIGKTLAIGSLGDIVAEVTGIVEDTPSNSHLHFDFLMSLETAGYYNNPVWINTEVYTYFKVFPDADITAIQKTLHGFIQKYCAPELERFAQMTMEQFMGQGGYVEFETQPLKDIHLRSHLNDEFEANGNIDYIYLFAGIALFILILACINFMNLSTARSTLRAKEIGIRKVVGAVRQRLIRQFMMESFLYAAIAFIIAFFLTYSLVLPFSLLSGKSLHAAMIFQPSFLLGFTLLWIFIGLLAGSYPALYLTSFKPVEVLKTRLLYKGGRSGVRNGLVVFQFFISIALIICSIMVYQQLSFLQKQELGFQKDNVVGLMHTMNLGTRAEPLRNEILSHSEFVAASYSSRLPPDIDWFGTFQVEGSEENHLMAVYTMDHDHSAVMGFEMVQGRFFSRDFPSDTLAVILNETAARELGIEKLDGQGLRNPGSSGPPLRIIGIVKDFNFETLKSSIRPMVLLLGSIPNWDIAVRLTPGNTAEKIELLQSIWNKYIPEAPFEYSFVDQNFDSKFKIEKRLGNVILVFTGLAVFIACLGLFGLAAFTAQRRSKEISIRKVMGASVTQVVLLLSGNFTKLILIAFILSIPISWYGMTKWLEGYAYHINFSITITIVAGVSALAIALLTVSFQAIKAAVQNPVNSLKND